MARKESFLSGLFDLKVNKSNLRVSNRESEHREFKLEFANNNIPKFSKAMAAFANRDGGVLFFGIKDKLREIVGVDENKIPDDVVFTNFLKEYFQPEIVFQSRILSIQGRKIHAILVKPSAIKPVICQKKSLKQGQGKTEEIILRDFDLVISFHYATS
jgi:predicted HTH transcriptional regulator